MKFKAKNKHPFLTKLDFFIIFIVLTFFLVVGLAVKFVFLKDTYITVELLASGGEWWWGTPPPYYWNVNPLRKGAIEYDLSGKPLVEILDVVKLKQDTRKFVWLKARIKVNKNIRTGVYNFRQTKIEIGKSINISPDHISLIGQVISIEGINSLGPKETQIVTGVLYSIRQWQVDSLIVGDTMKNDKGEVVAEILEKKAEPAEIVTSTWLGEPLLRLDPLFKDVTLKMRVVVNKEGNDDYFQFYQQMQIGQGINLQFAKTIIEPIITKIEKE